MIDRPSPLPAEHSARPQNEKDVDAKTILVNWGVTGEIEGGEKPILIAETLSRRSA